MFPTIFLHIIVFIYGIVIGSFLNVCIYRIPKKENIVITRSHCMSCNYQLRWYDLIPVISYCALGGKCRKCKAWISIQYPLVEGLNGVLYLIIFMKCGLSVDTLLYCLVASALLVLSVIDFRTYEIPVGINYFIFAVGLIKVCFDYKNIVSYIIGFFSVSLFLYLIYLITGGRGIGGGDVKLMAVCGLLLGWKLILLAFLSGCIIGSICHVIRMKLTKADNLLAMGPYLSIGVMIAMLWGNSMINWYLAYLGL